MRRSLGVVVPLLGDCVSTSGLAIDLKVGASPNVPLYVSTMGEPANPQPWWRPPRRCRALPVAMAAYSLYDVVGNHAWTGPVAVNAVVVTAMTLSLAFRRTVPLAVLVVVGTAIVGPAWPTAAPRRGRRCSCSWSPCIPPRRTARTCGSSGAVGMIVVLRDANDPYVHRSATLFSSTLALPVGHGGGRAGDCSTARPARHPCRGSAPRGGTGSPSKRQRMNDGGSPVNFTTSSPTDSASSCCRLVLPTRSSRPTPTAPGGAAIDPQHRPEAIGELGGLSVSSGRNRRSSRSRHCPTFPSWWSAKSAGMDVELDLDQVMSGSPAPSCRPTDRSGRPDQCPEARPGRTRRRPRRGIRQRTSSVGPRRRSDDRDSRRRPTGSRRDGGTSGSVRRAASCRSRRPDRVVGQRSPTGTAMTDDRPRRRFAC